MTNVTLSFEDGMKRELDMLVESMGMNLTTFFMIYAKRSLRDRRIPFEITAPADTLDPFFSERNMKRLEESERQFREGKVVVKTVEELEAMAND